MRASLPFTLLLLALLAACDSHDSSAPDIRNSPAPAPVSTTRHAARSTNSLPSDQVAALVRSLTQAQLPPGATNVHGAAASLINAIVDVRFECSSDELQSFLIASPVLKDELVVGKRAVVDTMNGHSWWQPDTLASVSGSGQSWPTTNGTVSAFLMTGESGVPGRVVVYLSMTIE